MSTYVAVGSVCWDVVAGADDARLGGSVLFASRAAQARGWHARIVTSGTPELAAALRRELPDVDVHVEPSQTDTVFGFSAQAELGPQWLVSRAETIELAEHRFADADVVHLAPVMEEIAPASFGATAGARFVGITPQGFLRGVAPRTGELVRRDRLEAWWVEHVGAVVLAEHEHARLAQPDALRSLPVAVTRGADGCVGRWYDEVLEVPGIDVGEVDALGTIGAGDVFAAVFFMALADGEDFAAALVGANEAAAAHVGRAVGLPAGLTTHPAVDPEVAPRS